MDIHANVPDASRVAKPRIGTESLESDDCDLLALARGSSRPPPGGT